MRPQPDVARDPEDRVIDEHNERDVREKMLDKPLPIHSPPIILPVLFPTRTVTGLSGSRRAAALPIRRHRLIFPANRTALAKEGRFAYVIRFTDCGTGSAIRLKHQHKRQLTER
jgi:hypothetical protein